MYNVMVVDDEVLEQEAIKSILEKHFFYTLEIKTASNGIEAVEAAVAFNADIVIMDIEMPGMNGLQALKQIKQNLPKCNAILLTAYGLFDYAQEAIKLNVKDYLLKPAQDEEIIEAINKIIQQLDEQNCEEKECVVVNNDKNGKIMNELDEYLHKNYMNNISLESVAGYMNFNPFYFSKLFKHYFNMNFIDYLTDIRINVAKQLLLDPHKSAKEVANMVSYNDSNYFTKIFKKKTGFTPTEYRNQ